MIAPNTAGDRVFATQDPLLGPAVTQPLPRPLSTLEEP